MDPTTLLTIGSFVLAYGLVSRRLDRGVVTAPMAFVTVGMLGAPQALGLIAIDVEARWVHTLAEATLVLVLFADAARIDLKALVREVGLPVRLLAIGMPLTVALGTGMAWLVFGDTLTLVEAALLAAILTPTDAALGQAVVSNEKVPGRIRQALNVESGLNDGIAVPVVMVLTAMAASEHGVAAPSAEGSGSWLRFALLQVTLGPIAGIAIGGTVWFEAMFAGPICGASMNPSRSLGPAIISGQVEHLWVYLAAPIAGAITGALLYQFLRHEHPKRD